MTTKPNRYRFSLRVAMGLVFVCSILLAFVIVPAHQHKRAIANIREAGGTIRFQIGSAETWIDKIIGKALGPDAVAKVFAVHLRKAKINSDFLNCFAALPELRELDLEDTSTVTDFS